MNGQQKSVKKLWESFLFFISNDDFKSAEECWSESARRFVKYDFSKLKNFFKQWQSISVLTIKQWNNVGVIVIKLSNDEGSQALKRYGFMYEKNRVFLIGVSSALRERLTRYWEKRESECFIYRFKKSDVIKEQDVLKQDEFCKGACRFLEIKLDRKVEYFKCSSDEEVRKISGVKFYDHSAQATTTGVTDPLSVSIISTKTFDPHEVTHAISTWLDGRPPDILREGIADAFYKPEDWETCVMTEGSLSICKLLRPWSISEFTCNRIDSSLFVKFLLDRFDLNLFKRFYSEAQEENFERILGRIYNRKASIVEAEWREWVKDFLQRNESQNKWKFSQDD
jgi:hypothetical protein